ncbi:MAG: sigma-70 family RNA polymerase sigma factor [Deltaproteobacteria bacterium]|nr:sigma-70 family RNA polymerase sigma factor [Deltaproteobacteria bacterium]
MNREIDDKNRIPDDVTLVREFQSGDRDVFDSLVIRHKDRIFNLCYRFLGDYYDAEDAAQEIFVKVYRSLKRFRLDSSFSTWLHRIAVNTCKNKIKSLEYRYRKKQARLNNDGIGENPYSMEPGQESHSPMAELERKERMKAIQKAIDALPAKQKTVVVLRDIQGFSYDEITRITGYKLGTLKSRLARARLDLRDKLKGVI